MHGNVWEWVEDCWNPNYFSAPENGIVRKSGRCQQHPLRGGSWFNNTLELRSASRLMRNADGAFGDVGFRLARAN